MRILRLTLCVIGLLCASAGTASAQWGFGAQASAPRSFRSQTTSAVQRGLRLNRWRSKDRAIHVLRRRNSAAIS